MMAAQLLAYYRRMRDAGYTRMVARLRIKEIIHRCRCRYVYSLTPQGRKELREHRRKEAAV